MVDIIPYLHRRELTVTAIGKFIDKIYTSIMDSSFDGFYLNARVLADGFLRGEIYYESEGITLAYNFKIDDRDVAGDSPKAANHPGRLGPWVGDRNRASQTELNSYLRQGLQNIGQADLTRAVIVSENPSGVIARTNEVRTKQSKKDCFAKSARNDTERKFSNTIAVDMTADLGERLAEFDGTKERPIRINNRLMARAPPAFHPSSFLPIPLIIDDALLHEFAHKTNQGKDLTPKRTKP